MPSDNSGPTRRQSCDSGNRAIFTANGYPPTAALPPPSCLLLQQEWHGARGLNRFFFLRFCNILVSKWLQVHNTQRGRHFWGLEVRSRWRVVSGRLFWSTMGPPICSADLLAFLRRFFWGGAGLLHCTVRLPIHDVCPSFGPPTKRAFCGCGGWCVLLLSPPPHRYSGISAGVEAPAHCYFRGMPSSPGEECVRSARPLT